MSIERGHCDWMLSRVSHLARHARTGSDARNAWEAGHPHCLLEVTCWSGMPRGVEDSVYMQNGSGSHSSGQFTSQDLLAKNWGKEEDGRPASAVTSNDGHREGAVLACERAQRSCQLDITNMAGTELLTSQV